MPAMMMTTREQRAARQSYPTRRDRMNVLRCDIKEVLHDAGHEGYTCRQLGRYFRYTFGADLRWALRTLVSRGIVVRTRSGVYRLRTCRVGAVKHVGYSNWSCAVVQKSLAYFGLYMSVADFVGLLVILIWFSLFWASPYSSDDQQQQSGMAMVSSNCCQTAATSPPPRQEQNDDDAAQQHQHQLPVCVGVCIGLDAARTATTFF